ncbi:MobC family plasmid mobilization relaxosome protein [Christensenellaceae bacterium OttesenSCG-928-M15]|nr:MobC family plasmid mobilization relaxosome protein [Christensenellaceae bacterium OttesenSCG-928-M15]
MRKRNIPMRVWLNEKEYADLTRKSDIVKMSRSSYIRTLISGHIPREPPPMEFHNLMRELRAIGNNMQQIAARANKTGYIHAEDYTANAKALKELTLSIYEAVTLPTRISGKFLYCRAS